MGRDFGVVWTCLNWLAWDISSIVELRGSCSTCWGSG